MLRESYSEKRSFAGCLVPVGLGVVGGALAGFWYVRIYAGEASSGPLAMDFMGAIVGACAGLFVGGLFGLLIDRVMTRRQRREEEF